MLLTDHLPLKDIPQTITEDLIIKKVSTTINHLTHIKNILIAGINPHAGENGLIGTEDQVINKAIIRLKQIYPTHTFQGPISGDTMYFMHQNESDLLVYPYHDQGLGVFKAIKKTYGINFTLGLPFKRLSVDHGTAFALFGKNSANYSGALYCLETVFK